MPHFPKPWFRKSRGWYVTIDGRQVPLGSERDHAFRKYRELVASPPPAPPPLQSDAVAVLRDRVLDWAEKHRSPDTYCWYKDRLQAFLKHIPGELTINELKPFHVQEWIDAMTCRSGTKRNYVRAVKRAMAWAEEQGYIQRSPFAHLRKPAGGRRQAYFEIAPGDPGLMALHAGLLLGAGESG